MFTSPEVGTAQQARMAWHRDMASQEAAAAGRRGLTDPTIAERHGEYRVPGQTLEEIRATAEPPGMGEQRKAIAGRAEAESAELKRQQELAKSKEAKQTYSSLMQEGPFATFDKSKGTLAFMPKDEDEARDAKAGENWAAKTMDAQAGVQHFNERRMARKYLNTLALPADFDVNAYLNAVSASDEAWDDFKKRMSKTNLTAAPERSNLWTDLDFVP
jgi:hypothetical protein